MMPQLILILVGIGIAVMLLWIAFVFVARILAIVIGLVIILGGVALLVGVIAGLVIPYRVLRSKSSTTPAIATPDDVEAGKIIRIAPGAAARNFGWDYAWPNYVPYQLRLDQAAVIRQCAGWSRLIFARIRTKWFAVAVLPAAGLVAGLWAGTLLWYALTWVFRALVVMGQSIALRFMRAKDARFMKSEGATVHCVQPGCYGATDMPSFRCPNPDCRTIHRDMAPGRLGIRDRVCGCGEVLPLTVARASRELEAICPFCDAALPQGSGSRRVIRVPVLGPVASGKTQFLASSAASLSENADDVAPGLTITPLSNAAGEFLTRSVAESLAGQAPAKTGHDTRPEGFPFLIQRPNSEFEMHLMDAAGENFVSAENSRALTYLNDATAYVFLLDPLTIGEVGDRLRRSALHGQVSVAQGSTDDAYGSVIDQLEDLDRRRIAVVLTKADIVARISDGEELPVDSAAVREWLLDVGEDRLIARIESDFRDVTYFTIDSTIRGRIDHPQHPLRVIDWALTAQGGVSMFPAPEPVHAGAAPEASSPEPDQKEHAA